MILSRENPWKGKKNIKVVYEIIAPILCEEKLCNYECEEKLML